MTDRPHVVVLDNYDSFTYNLVEYLGRVAAVTVLENDVALAEVEATDPDGIVLSPGPGHPATPRDVGVTPAVLEELSPEVPTLGVCLGLETAVHVYGGTVDRAPAPVHGKASPVHHDGRGIFAGLPADFPAGRYHSLVATAVPDCFEVSATTPVGGGRSEAGAADVDPEASAADGADLVMGIRHREHPIVGVQFHPESVLTGAGPRLLGNFADGLAG